MNCLPINLVIWWIPLNVSELRTYKRFKQIIIIYCHLWLIKRLHSYFVEFERISNFTRLFQPNKINQTFQVKDYYWLVFLYSLNSLFHWFLFFHSLQSPQSHMLNQKVVVRNLPIELTQEHFSSFIPEESRLLAYRTGNPGRACKQWLFNQILIGLVVRLVLWGFKESCRILRFIQ